MCIYSSIISLQLFSLLHLLISPIFFHFFICSFNSFSKVDEDDIVQCTYACMYIYVYVCRFVYILRFYKIVVRGILMCVNEEYLHAIHIDMYMSI